MSAINYYNYTTIREQEQLETSPSVELTPISTYVSKIGSAKLVKMEEARSNKWTFNNVVFVTGDLFTSADLGFQALLCLSTKTQSIAAVAFTSFVCGEIGGAINIFVGIGCLKEAIQSFKNGAALKGARLAADFICLLGIGVVMILISLALKVSAVGAIGAFFATNPWFLPLLFFIITIPVFLEIGKGLVNLYNKTDLGSKLNLEQLGNMIETQDWNAIEKLMQNTDSSWALGENPTFEKISSKMEEFQADFGVEGAVAVFDLWNALLEKNQEKAKAKLLIAKKALADWNWSLYIRMLQQVFYIVAFGVSMGCVGASTNLSNQLNGSQNIFSCLANAIPTYMDAFWPFKRNAPIVVPLIEKHEIA